MPRVKSVFTVSGAVDFFLGETPLRMTLTVVKGGLLLGRVTHDTPRHMEIALIDGKASVDLFESTESHAVYSCQFSLVQYDNVAATIIDCAARVSDIGGLVGRWNTHGSLGKKGVCDHAFEMETVRTGESDLVEASGGSEPEVKSVALLTVAGGATIDETHELLLCGDAVDQNGCVYTTTLQATLFANGSVMGVSTEAGKRCQLIGSWSGSNVSYTLDYPINGRMTQYSYRGVLERHADGNETLSGTWKYEKQSADDDELFGGFEFCSLKLAGINVQTIVPGACSFTGVATSDSGTKYDSTLTLTLAADGSLTGKSEELSIVPQVCELKGSWDAAESMIAYRMTYSNGCTGTYEYVGKLHSQQLVGRWVNPRAADRESERGDFVFSLTSFHATPTTDVKLTEAVIASDKSRVKEEAVASEETTDSANRVTTLVPENLVPGKYMLTGTATSDGGTKYDSKLTLCLSADGSLTGKSEELSIAPQDCELTGSWTKSDNKITYSMTYSNGCTASYEYVGQVEGQDLVGRWVNSDVTDLASERGDFTFHLTSFTARDASAA